MSDPNTLTEAEQEFFRTGSLPQSLLAEHDVSALSDTPSEEPAPTPAPEPAANPEPPAPPQDSQSALDILRRSLQEAESRRADAEAALKQAQAPKPEPEPPMPDPDADPLGFMQHQLVQVNKQVAELQRQLLEQSGQQTQLQQVQQFQRTVMDLKAEFVKTTPDFDAGYQHLRTARAADLRDAGVPEAQIPEMLLRDEFAIAQNAIQRGANPAQAMYEMAKRHGYRAAAPAPAPSTKMDQLQAGMAAAKTAPASVPPAQPLTPENIKNLSDSDLNKLVLDEKAWARLTGRADDIFHN